MRPRLLSSLSWTFLAFGAICAVAHVSWWFRSELPASLALWSMILSLIFGGWSLIQRLAAPQSKASGFEVIKH
jgi:hypothetical protein